MAIIAMPAIIRVSSNEIRATFKRWLTDGEAGIRLVILEGLTNSGKTWLTMQPFALNTRHSVNIELDNFLERPVPKTTPYVDAIDCAALDAALNAALSSSALVVLQGAIAWPLVQAAVATLGKDRVRRVYLKRMMWLKPDIWVDEDFIRDPKHWPQDDFIRSVYQYHAEQPWRSAHLILERVEEDTDAHRD